jgi:HK97 family phage major capsid protein
MEHLNELGTLAHAYRKELARIDASGRDSQHVDTRGHGEEREKFARMDADLTAIELAEQDRAALRAANDRIKALEAERNQPQYRAVAPKRATGHDLASPEYAMRWLKAVSTGDQAEMRALSLGSTGAGIPTDMERRIVEKMYAVNVLRTIAPVSTIDSKRTITIESGLPTSALVAEAGAITPSDPTFGTAVSIIPYKYVCATTMSQEFIEDAIGSSGIGSGLDYVASRIGMSLGLKMEEAYTVGTGTDQPQGIAGVGTNSASAMITTASQTTDLSGGAITTITADNLIDTVHLVQPQYRNSPRFRWLVSDTFVRVARKLKNSVTTSGATEYIWTQAPANSQTMVGGAPGLLYGVPYSIGQYMATAATNGNVFATVGDFNYFEIFDRTGMTSLVDPYSAASTHSVTLYTYARTDCHLMNVSAFAQITC